MQSSQSLNASAASTLMEFDEKESNYDILECFPPWGFPVCQHVFQHLDIKELLEMSTVNREWNRFVGERPQVKKLTIKISEKDHELTRKTEDILKRSVRKYENIEIMLTSSVSEFLLCFLGERAGSWKTVDVKTDESIAQDIWPKILGIIEPTVELLWITDRFEPKEPSTVATNWTFPYLEILKCRVDYHNMYKYFGNVTSLVKLDCQDTYDQVDEVEGEVLVIGAVEVIPDMRTLLRNNNNLKELDAFAETHLFEDLSDVKFKLQKLQIYDESGEDFTERFLPFLKTQTQSLTTLDVSEEMNSAHLELIVRMPRLTKLTGCFILDEIQEFPVNSTITHLELTNNITAREEVTARARIAYQNLIRSLKKLMCFKCNEIDDELFLFLAMDIPNLLSIETFHFNVLRIPQRMVFPWIAKFETYQFHEDFQTPTGNYKFAQLVKSQIR